MNFPLTKAGNFLATQVDKLGLTIENYEQLPFEFLSVSSSRHLFPLSYSGYFQNFSYVEEAINNYIHPLMEYIDRISAPTRQRLKLGQETPIVHVRRGDLNRPENRWMGTLGGKYIADALDSFNVTSSDAVLFTDDIEGTLDVQEEFGIKRLIGPEETSAWETLSVFATSSNLVMANSTLSWWGGYLASRSGNSVIMPNQWFKDSNRSPGERLHIPGVNRIDSSFA
jgi:hypothetical protein